MEKLIELFTNPTVALPGLVGAMVVSIIRILGYKSAARSIANIVAVVFVITIYINWYRK